MSFSQLISSLSFPPPLYTYTGLIQNSCSMSYFTANIKEKKKKQALHCWDAIGVLKELQYMDEGYLKWFHLF